MLNLTHRRGSFQTRFAASWKWMLTIACIKSQGLSDDATASEIRRQSKEIGIHPSLSKPFQKHQQLFSVAGIETMPDKALITGLQAISDLSILNRIEKKLRNSIGPPWDHILPEDIGSCYELIR